MIVHGCFIWLSIPLSERNRQAKHSGKSWSSPDRNIDSPAVAQVGNYTENHPEPASSHPSWYQRPAAPTAHFDIFLYSVPAANG